MEVAQSWAVRHGKTTLEQATGGQFSHSLDLFGKKSHLTPIQAAEIWDIASKRFAQGATGTVNLFATRTTKLNPWGRLRTWWQIGQPALRGNSNVMGIIQRRIDGGRVRD